MKTHEYKVNVRKDGKFEGHCTEHPGLSCLAMTAERAWKAIQKIVEEFERK